MVLLLAGSVGAYLFYLDNTVRSNISHGDLLPMPPRQAGKDTAKPSPSASKKDKATEEAPAAPLPTSSGTNYLIVGVDTRPGTDYGSDGAPRSDAIIIAHVPDDHSRVYLVHFPRDLYVDIPGHGKDKLNVSYRDGQIPRLVETLQNLLHLQIDHVAKTDMASFYDMTDAMGGVRVWAEQPSKGINKGWNDLNGSQALAFVRERKTLSHGDVSRGQRQLAFIKAVLTKAVSRDVLLNPVRFAQITDAATRNLVLDRAWGMGDIRSEALALAGLRGNDIVFFTAPFSSEGLRPVVGYVEIVDQARMDALGTALRTSTMDQYLGGRTIP